MKAAIVYILLSFACITIYGQRKLSKEEILQDHKTSQIKRQLSKDSTKLTWDDNLNLKLHNCIDSLKKSGIDSLIIYSVSYPGSIHRMDTCISKYSTSVYLIWKVLGEVNIKKIYGKCHFTTVSDKWKDIFSFYDAHSSQLNDEMFMPIIFSGQISDNNRITYETSLSFHETKYSLYYDIHSNYNSFSFGESELTNEQSIFYTYNLDLAAYHWWKLISENANKLSPF
jgi:hypothetical protein